MLVLHPIEVNYTHIRLMWSYGETEEIYRFIRHNKLLESYEFSGDFLYASVSDFFVVNNYLMLYDSSQVFIIPIYSIGI